MSKSKNSGRIRMLSIWENSFSQFISYKPNKHPEGDWSCIIMVPKVCCRFSISEFKSSKDLEIVLTPFLKGFPYIQNRLLSPCRPHEATVTWAFMSPGLICASLNGHTCHPLKEPRKLCLEALRKPLCDPIPGRILRECSLLTLCLPYRSLAFTCPHFHRGIWGQSSEVTLLFTSSMILTKPPNICTPKSSSKMRGHSTTWYYACEDSIRQHL